MSLFGAAAGAQNIVTYMGGEIGDGRVAVNAQLRVATDVAFGQSGTLYVADANDYRIRKVTSSGIISTVAGTGSSSNYADCSGSGVSATSVAIYPTAIAVDHAGNVLAADPLANCIRKISPAGVLTTFAGSGAFGFSGDGGSATAAQFEQPSGVAVDAHGNVYISDGSQRIRKVDLSGNISTVASYILDARALTLDPSGNIFVISFQNNAVWKVDSQGNETVFAGAPGARGYSGDGGPATGALLSSPAGAKSDAFGNLYIADAGNNVIRRIDAGGTITTIAGNGLPGLSGDGGPALNAAFSYPTGIDVDAFGKIVIADSGNLRAREIGAGGLIATIAGGANYPDGTSASTASVLFPRAIAVDAGGNLFVADSGNQRIRKVRPDTAVFTIAGTGAPGFSGDGGKATQATLTNASAIAIDNADNIYFADGFRVRKVNATGNISTIAGTGTGGCTSGGLANNTEFFGIYGLAVDANGNLYVSDSGCRVVRRIAATGAIATVAGTGTSSGNLGDGGPATSAELSTPEGIAFDRVGNLYIAEMNGNRIRKVGMDGIITTVAGTGWEGFSGDGGRAVNAQICSPNAVTVDDAGNLYISDSSNSVIRQVTANGIIHTIAGSGYGGFFGDGGPATSASFSGTVSVAVHRSSLYIADFHNQRIRMVSIDRIFSDNFDQ